MVVVLVLVLVLARCLDGHWGMVVGDGRESFGMRGEERWLTGVLVMGM